jgi:hypothetical protein
MTDQPHQFTDDYQIDADFRGETLTYSEAAQRTTIMWTWANGYTIYADTLGPWLNADGSSTPLTDLDRTTILQRLVKYAKDVQHVTMKVE